MPLSEDLRKRLDELVHDKKVVLFMKGSRHFPQCGFSAQVVQILNDVAGTYETVNVLSDPQLRDGIKEYSSWPTIPQLYIGGQFVGGCDIVKDMYASGDLQKALGAAGVSPKAAAAPASAAASADAKPPAIKVSDSAKAAFQKAEQDAEGDKLRLEINAQFQVELFFAPPQAGDLLATANGVTIRFDAESARRAEGLSIDFVQGPGGGGGFKIENPNEPARVKPLSAGELKKMIDGGESFELIDVRPETERQRAKIARALTFDEGKRRMSTMDKSAKVVFHCHHGMRSRAAAEEAVREGFRNVYNLEGGIDAWSSIEPGVPRY